MNIIDAIRDPDLLGRLPCFADLQSWARWLVFLCALEGSPLEELAPVGISAADALAIFREHTGRSTPRPGGYAEAAAITGCQSGKSRVAGAIADVAAITAPAEADGTELYVALVAQDQRSSLRTLFSYARAAFDTVPVLKASVTARRAETITLENGCTLAVYPCRPQAVRGIRARVVICDELAFYRSTEGFPTDREMLRVARSRVATTGGKVIILSSPYAQSGALYELHAKHFGHDDSPVLVWQASAQAMNPKLPENYLLRMEQDDPEAYASEVLGQFQSGTSMLFEPEAVGACVEIGVHERAPDLGVFQYVSFNDAASGSGQDAFTTSVVHGDGKRIVVDALRTRMPPFSPSDAIEEAAALLKTYGLTSTSGDRYAPGFVSEGFRQHGISYTPSELDRSALYLELLPLVNAGRVVLLDIPELLRELRGLERRRGSSGKDRVDHLRGAHDDRANAVAGAVVQVAARTTRYRTLQEWEG